MRESKPKLWLLRLKIESFKTKLYIYMHNLMNIAAVSTVSALVDFHLASQVALQLS